MIAILLIILIGLTVSAYPAHAENSLTVINNSSLSSTSTSSQSCNTDITINGQHYHSSDCNTNISDKNGQVTTTPSAHTSTKPKPPVPPKQPTTPTFPFSTPTAPGSPKAPVFSGISTQTAQVQRQVSQFVQHLQQEIDSLLHSLFRF